jgi:hypothetical protein
LPEQRLYGGIRGVRRHEQLPIAWTGKPPRASLSIPAGHGPAERRESPALFTADLPASLLPSLP